MKNSKQSFFIALFPAALAFAACGSDNVPPVSDAGGDSSTGSGGSSAGNGGSGTGGQNPVDAASLRSAYADFFTIGAAVGAWQLDNTSEILSTHFNRLTAENAMKMGIIQPVEGTFDWAEADRIANFARDNDMKMTGHALLWHRQIPNWLFSDLTVGGTGNQEILKQRLKAHIDAMVERYADVVDNWDVVNEAISDQGGKTYRDGAEPTGSESGWYQYFGNEDYIYWAFKYAHDALEAKAPGSSKGKLYYNDYSETLKITKILEMAEWLKGKGVTLDGIGFQGHYTLDWPTIASLQTTIDAVVAAGYKVKFSEIDITVYSDYTATGMLAPKPEVPFTEALEAQQAERYRALFKLFRDNKEHITSVTFWGVTDDRTWLDNEPVPGRNNYPLLWDDNKQPKAALDAILKF